MKILIILGLAVFCQAKGIKEEHGEVEGLYNIQSVANSLFLTAGDNGSPPNYLGKVMTTKLQDDLDGKIHQFWSVTARYNSGFHTMMSGANAYNEVSAELPAPGSYHLFHYWKFNEVKKGVWQFKSDFRFTEGAKENMCLQVNGENEALSLGNCNAKNIKQHFKFVDRV